MSINIPRFGDYKTFYSMSNILQHFYFFLTISSLIYVYFNNSKEYCIRSKDEAKTWLNVRTYIIPV